MINRLHVKGLGCGSLLRNVILRIVIGLSQRPVSLLRCWSMQMGTDNVVAVGEGGGKIGCGHTHPLCWIPFQSRSFRNDVEMIGQDSSRSTPVFTKRCPQFCLTCRGGGDSSVVRAPNSWLKGRGFESLLERWENFLLQGRLSVLTLISVSVPPPCYHSST